MGNRWETKTLITHHSFRLWLPSTSVYFVKEWCKILMGNPSGFYFLMGNASPDGSSHGSGGATISATTLLRNGVCGGARVSTHYSHTTLLGRAELIDVPPPSRWFASKKKELKIGLKTTIFTKSFENLQENNNVDKRHWDICMKTSIFARKHWEARGKTTKFIKSLERLVEKTTMLTKTLKHLHENSHVHKKHWKLCMKTISSAKSIETPAWK